MELQDYLPTNQDEEMDVLSDPIAKRARDYFEEVHPVEYLAASFDNTLDQIIIYAVANYNFTCSKHITNGGDTSVADEIAMDSLIKTIEEKIVGLVKY
ncbi:hypothetical protein [Plebeiibacterium sediminum]|uniref:Phage gp6-like head-tail connector protein n=1 Tax=Plebeiibacterium sediminum TaxID=2992112 RepID=A0AAE3M7E2_9BACT|nr:hypothetical protein [Plebeiobacterium sediminum]MCW3788361.1 hypothetical protein [Plebeiobacterium sediminum]